MRKRTAQVYEDQITNICKDIVSAAKSDPDPNTVLYLEKAAKKLNMAVHELEHIAEDSN